MKKLLRPDQAAAELNVSKRTIYRLCSSGDLVCLFIGQGERTLRIKADSLDEYIQRQTKRYILSEGVLNSVTGGDS